MSAKGVIGVVVLGWVVAVSASCAPGGATLDSGSSEASDEASVTWAEEDEPVGFDGLWSDELPLEGPLAGVSSSPLPRALTGPVLNPPWTSGHGIAVHDGELVVADEDNRTLVVLDQESLTARSVVTLGGRPEQVVVGPDGIAWVTIRDTGELVSVDLAEGSVTARIAGLLEPIGLALSADGSRLYVSDLALRTVSVHDGADGTLLQTVVAGRRPRSVAWSSAGHLVGVDQNDGMQRWMFGADGLLVEYSRGDLPLRRSVPWDVSPDDAVSHGRGAALALAAAVHPTTGDVYVPHHVLRPLTTDDLRAVYQPVVAAYAASWASYQSALEQYDAANTVAYYGPPPPPQPPAGPGQEVVADVVSRTPERPLEPVVVTVGADGELREPVRSSAQVGTMKRPGALSRHMDKPVDAVHHPHASLLLVVGEGTDNVVVFNTAVEDPLTSPLAIIEVGQGPRAIAVAADGQRAWTVDGTGLTVSEIDLTPILQAAPSEAGTAGVPLVGEWFAPLDLEADRTVPFAQDPWPAALRAGQRVFTHADNPHVSLDGRFSCSSCHYEGGQDDAVWTGPAGARQTPALAGRLADTAPYNWLGSKSTLHTNIALTVSRMSGDGLTAAESEHLQGWLLSGLQPPRNPHRSPAGLTPEQTLGRTLFEDDEVGCAGCHEEAALTDGDVHDLGTASDDEMAIHQLLESLPGVVASPRVLNTPSLRDLFATAPYLHDGSAATLYEVLEQTEGQMGTTGHLTAEERDALVAYLLTL